jgi:hypothetical protein
MTDALGRARGGRKPPKRVALDGNILKQNRISVLTLDERWNSLFACADKTDAIRRGEEALNGCIKAQAKLTAELSENHARKKRLLGRIVELSKYAFNAGGEGAKKEIAECEAQIRFIKSREPEIDEQLSMLYNDVRNANIDLLEMAAAHVYSGILESKRRLRLLDANIAELGERLRERSLERESLGLACKSASAGLLDLLGADQMDELGSRFAEK